ncbi:MAG: hypothetical protein ABFS32_01350 [Bacteroidota bacterium]
MKFYSRKIILIISALLLIIGCASESTEYRLDNWSISIDSKGQITNLSSNGINYAEVNQKPVLLSLKVDSTIINPIAATITNNKDQIKLDFENGISAEVRVIPKEKHITFELISISDDSNIDAVIWGPFATIINKSIGETIGIVQNDEFTFGLQALNLKTLGGYPWKDDDHLPQMNIFEQDDYDDFLNGKGGVLYSVEAAKPTGYGSSLQAYTRNRKQDRVIENWRHDRYLAPTYNDGGVLGSKIALFGCKTDSTLATIGEIEVAEGLPHPTINGKWIKTSPVINSSYLIMSFTEDNIDACIDYTKKSGFGYLYHGHPFESWGHFPLLPDQFPNGWDGMKACVDKAEAQGVYIGTHTLTNFINTKDSYVTPVPDSRLAKVGNSVLINEIDNTQTEIEIESPDFFNQYKKNHLKSVVIGNEIIRYSSVSESEPWTLKDCERGVFGTTASNHNQGTTISKLADHGYKVFLGDVDLNKEMAENIAKFMNQTGVRMLDFDGLEGAHSTGMGNYGEVLFAQQWHDALNENIKNHYLLGASRPGHYFWHLYSRMNWGEPWYAGFRESQTEYRLKNQAYFKRNLMPGMLGWFKMTPSTTTEDIEWLMVRSAAYNAGFAFVTSLETLEKNGKTEEIFSILNTWETARLNGVFTQELQDRMLDLSSEFRLKKTADGILNLTQVFSNKFTHEKKVRQPGEPLYSTFEFENNSHEQPLNFIITAMDSDLSSIIIEINNHRTIDLPIELKKGQSIKYTNQESAIVYDNNWNEINTVPIIKEQLNIQKGDQSITFDCTFTNTSDKPLAKVELIVLGEPEKIN